MVKLWLRGKIKILDLIYEDRYLLNFLCMSWNDEEKYNFYLFFYLCLYLNNELILDIFRVNRIVSYKNSGERFLFFLLKIFKIIIYEIDDI